MNKIIENLKIAFRALYLNKLRTFLTMLGIIIGVGSVTAVLSIGAGAEQAVIQNIQDMGSNLITITPGNFEDLTAAEINFNGQQAKLTIDDVKAIEREATLITKVAPVLINSTITSYSNKKTRATMYASTENGQEILNVKIKKGNFYSRSDVSNALSVAVIGQTVINNLFNGIDPIGKMIKIDGKNFKVIGTLETRGVAALGNDLDDFISIPITAAQNKLHVSDSYSMIKAQSISEEIINDASDEIKSILRIQRKIIFGEKEDFMIQNQTQMVALVAGITTIITIVIASIAGIALLVGGIGIMNIMLVSITERTREIGIRKAVGAENKDILIQFLVESIVLSFAGGIFGLLFAIAVSAIITSLTDLKVTITLSSIIIAFGFSASIGLFFGIYPAMQAAKLNPIDALRYE